MAYEKEFEDLKNFRDIGESFSYMGVNCVVTCHRDVVFGPFGGSVYPLLSYVYSDKNGIIRKGQANMVEFEIIKKQNQPG